MGVVTDFGASEHTTSGGGAQQLGHDHHRQNAGHTAHQLRYQDGEPLLFDHIQLQIEGHTQGHHRRLQPEVDVMSRLTIRVVTDARQFQEGNQNQYRDQDGIEQNPSRTLLKNCVPAKTH